MDGTVAECISIRERQSVVEQWFGCAWYEAERTTLIIF